MTLPKLPEKSYQRPPTFQIRLASLLLWSAAIPLWVFLIVGVGNSTGFGSLGFVVAPFALVVATAALFLLLRGTKDGLAMSVFVAAAILLSALIVATIISRHWYA